MRTEGGVRVDDIQEIVRSFQQGSEDALRVLVERYSQQLYRMAVVLTRSPAIAHDLVQETFIKSWQHRAQLKNPDKYVGWLYSILHNTFRDWSRLRWRREMVSEDVTRDIEDVQVRLGQYPPSPEERVAINEEARILKSALKTLPKLDQQILALRYGNNLSIEEIGIVLGLRPGTVATRVHRALRKLQSLLPDLRS
jgi:RNA polymerase sigma-70 factor (ECF subfamily)